MKNCMKYSYITLSLILICMGIVNAFILSPMLLKFLSLLGFIFLFISLFSVPFKSSILPLLLISIMLFINVWGIENKLENLSVGIREMQPIVTLVLIVPLIGIVLKEGKYLESIFTYTSKARNSGILIHIILLILSQIISIFLLVVTSPTIYQMIDKTLKNTGIWKYINITAIYRGVALAGIWVFSFPSFALAVETFEVSIVIAITHGIILALVGILLSTLFMYVHLKKSNFFNDVKHNINRAKENDYQQYENKKNIIEFLICITILFSIIMILNYITSLSILTIIPLAIIVWSISILLIKFKYSDAKGMLKSYILNDLYTKRKEITLFLASGLLVVALDQSGIGTILITKVYEVTVDGLSINFLVIIPLIVLALALLGIPPSASMVLVALLVKNIQIPFASESIVIVLALGTVISVLLSPVAIPGILLSSVSHINSGKLTIQMNYLYAIIFFLIVQLYAYFLSVIIV